MNLPGTAVLAARQPHIFPVTIFGKISLKIWTRVLERSHPCFWKVWRRVVSLIPGTRHDPGSATPHISSHNIW